MTSMNSSQIDWLCSLLARTAKQEIMPRFRRLAEGDIRLKTSAADLVTDADEQAERTITAELLAHFPGALVVGEEACSADPSKLEGLSDAELAFVIDPIDGTFNFASDVPLFGVMLAIVQNGETTAGIIHDPVGGDWMLAERGAGACIRTVEGAERPIRVADPVPVSQMTGAVSWQFMDEPERSLVARNQAKCLSHVSYRCAAHEYRLISSGHAHFAAYSKLMPWDHLAGALIHEEAGGYVARLDGSAYRPGHVNGGIMAAPDRESWLALREALWADA